ncbi:MAG: hypothetical protein L3J17_13390 [Candidatus Jettenia sp.]|nr:MAG: hypothetical protein L3J17_13390 [Candidatus Jettenia sp.]
MVKDNIKTPTEAKAKITTNHEEIKKWAEERGGRPATIRGTGKENEPGLLRIDFPGYGSEEKLQEITWDEFFEKFEKEELAFLYQEETKGGKQSRFNKIISRDTAKK